jgi:hypothetical protein
VVRVGEPALDEQLDLVHAATSFADMALRAMSGDCPRPWPERPRPNCADGVTIRPRT